MNGIHEVAGSIPAWSTNLRPRDMRAGYGWRALLAKVPGRGILEGAWCHLVLSGSMALA